MSIDPAFLAILAIGLTCFAMRAGGHWIASSFDLPRPVLDYLDRLPAPLLAAMVFSAAWSLDPIAALLAALVTIAAMKFCNNEILAALAGTGSAWLVLMV